MNHSDNKKMNKKNKRTKGNNGSALVNPSSSSSTSSTASSVIKVVQKSNENKIESKKNIINDHISIKSETSVESKASSEVSLEKPILSKNQMKKQRKMQKTQQDNNSSILSNSDKVNQNNKILPKENKKPETTIIASTNQNKNNQNNNNKNNKPISNNNNKKKEISTSTPIVLKKDNNKKVIIENKIEASSSSSSVKDNDDSDDSDDSDEQLLELPFEVKAVEEELSNLEDLHDKETAKLVSKFDDLRAPLFAKRREALKKIPGFWYSAVGSHECLCDFIEECDVDILEKIQDVFVERNNNGYKIYFEFSEDNQYFSPKNITVEVKTIKAMQDKDLETISREDLVDRVIKSDEIIWKPNMKPQNLNNNNKVESNKKRLRKYSGFFSNFGKDANPVDSAVFFGIIANDLFPDAVNYYQHCEDSDEDNSEQDEEEEEEEEDSCCPPKKSNNDDDSDDDESDEEE